MAMQSSLCVTWSETLKTGFLTTRLEWYTVDILVAVTFGHLNKWEAPLAQLVECRTLNRKVAGSNLTRGAVLCP